MHEFSALGVSMVAESALAHPAADGIGFDPVDRAEMMNDVFRAPRDQDLALRHEECLDARREIGDQTGTRARGLKDARWR